MNLRLGLSKDIIKYAKEKGVLRNQLAYILASAYWESARTMMPVREYGSESYLRSKRYYPYVGMGLVQLTWRANYEKASRKLGVDFVASPKLLLESDHSVRILVDGMIDGWFTGKKLADYITLQKSDFRNARRIVNGMDKASEIAKIARDYDAALKREGYGETPGERVNLAPKSDVKPEVHKPLTQSKEIITGITALIAAITAFLDQIPQDKLFIALAAVGVGVVVNRLWARYRDER